MKPTAKPRKPRTPRKPRANEWVEFGSWEGGPYCVLLHVHEPWKEGTDQLKPKEARRLGERLIAMADWLDANAQRTAPRRGRSRG